MTSWIRVPPPLKRRDEEAAAPQQRALLLTATEEDVPTQFLNFFYTTLYCRAAQQPLLVYDKFSTVSASFGIFQSTFYDISGVTYTDNRLQSGTPAIRRLPQIREAVAKMTLDDVRDEAQIFFELNDTAGERVKEYLKGVGLPKEPFDVGVFYSAGDAIGTGTQRGASVPAIVAKLREFQAAQGLKAMRVFLASADANLAFDLKRTGDASWTFYSLPPTRVATAVGTSPGVRARQEAFTHELAQLVILQNLPVVGRLGSSLGRILYLTRTDASSMLSVDGPARFTFF